MSKFVKTASVSEHAVCAMYEPLNKEEVVRLLESIPVGGSVSRLCLFSASLSYEHAVEISKMLKLTETLQVLNLGENYDIGDRGTAVLADALEHNETIIHVNFENINISDSGAFAIGKCLQVNRSILSLNLQYNSIGCQGMSSSTLEVGIGDSLKVNRTLTELILNGNDIGSEGVKSLRDALKTNNTLQILKIARNGIDDIGARLLSDGLKVNCSLRELDIRNNNIDIDGSMMILEAVGRPLLLFDRINLSGNRYSYDNTKVFKLNSFVKEHAFLNNKIACL